MISGFWLVYLACLRSHVLRAYRNFESKTSDLDTLFGRHPNNKVQTLTTKDCKGPQTNMPQNVGSIKT